MLARQAGSTTGLVLAWPLSSPSNDKPGSGLGVSDFYPCLCPPASQQMSLYLGPRGSPPLQGLPGQGTGAKLPDETGREAPGAPEPRSQVPGAQSRGDGRCRCGCPQQKPNSRGSLKLPSGRGRPPGDGGDSLGCEDCVGSGLLFSLPRSPSCFFLDPLLSSPWTKVLEDAGCGVERTWGGPF